MRNYAKTLRDSFSAEYIKKCSLQVLENISSLGFNLKNSTVMAYQSIRGEINLDKLEEIAKQPIYYPTIENGVVVAKCGGFEMGEYGILSPTQGEISGEEIDIIFVPGVAFSKNMQRIGFGKGYYDVFLQNYKGIKIGITYEEFMFENITPDKFDIPMDIIITQNNIYKGQA